MLLLPEDEVALQAAIVAAHPGTRIIDAMAPWPAKTTCRPPVRDSVLEVGQRAALWDPEIHPRLPQPRFTHRPLARAPQAGRVVMWTRSACSDGVLTSGMFTAVVWDGMDPRMIAFTSTVWRAVLRATSNYLVRWLESTGREQIMPTYRIGHHALVAARAGEISLESGVGRLYPPSRDKARGAVL